MTHICNGNNKIKMIASFCPYCGHKVRVDVELSFDDWMRVVGMPTLKREIKEYEEEGLIMGLFAICETIYKENEKR